MTTDPTPHTERAAAAAAELNDLGKLAHSPASYIKEKEAAAIIAKHFNDATFAPASSTHPTSELGKAVESAGGHHFNDDALRLAAGRALERLKEDLEQQTRLQLVLKKFGPDSKSRAYANEIKNIITALSAALAGEQMGKE